MIRSKHQVAQPGPIVNDSRGIRIEPGLKVAFNRSGDIVLGTIITVKKNVWKDSRQGVGNQKWWTHHFEMHIKGEDGNTSKIKNANSFIII